MTMRSEDLRATCPACGARVTFRRRPGVGQRVVCPDCEESLRVVRTSPRIRLDYEGYDFDEDEEWEEEEEEEW